MKKTIITTILTQAIVFAAAPTSSDILNTLPAQESLPKQTKSAVEIKGIQEYKPALTEEQYTKKILVKSFKITNAKHIDTKHLVSLLDEYKNKELSFNDLQKAAYVITQEYKKKGYFISRAYIPAQTMKDDQIEISVIEGNYDKFVINNNSRVNDALLHNILNKAKTKDIAHLKPLESSLLNTNELPGVQITSVELKPGKTIGTSDLVINADKDNLYNGYVVADNHGSRYTGYNRLIAGANFNSLANVADKLSLSGLITNGSDLKTGRVAYGVPLFYTGAYAELGYSTVKYELAKEYENLKAYGKSSAIDLTINYPLINTKQEKLDIDFIYANKDLKDYQDSANTMDKTIDSFALSLGHTKDWSVKDIFVKTNSNIKFTTGKLTFNDETFKSADSAGVDTQGRYNKIDVSLNALTTFNDTYSLDTKLKFQKSLNNKNLDGSEDFSLGGTDGVRFFPSGELSAENGLVLQTELIVSLPTYKNIKHSASIFYDIGSVSMADSSKDTTFKSRTLQDVGVGYQAYYDKFFAKTYLAKSVGSQKVESEPEYSTKFLVQVGYVF